LWKPGAELICTLFQLGTRYPKSSMLIERENGHFLFTLTCELFHIPTGRIVGEGVGAASSMEYRFRVQTEDRYSDHGQPIKAKYTPYDFYNTVLKVAKKRSFVNAVLTASGASEIFTADTEDNPELYQDQDRQTPQQSLPKPPAGSPRLKKANGNGQQKAEPEFIKGTVERTWRNAYQGRTYWFAKVDGGRQLQTTDEATGEQLLEFEPGNILRVFATQSPKQGKFYIEKIVTVEAESASAPAPAAAEATA
jgi:hypothetical protein